MGFFDWFRGTKRFKPTFEPDFSNLDKVGNAPELLPGQDENSVWVMTRMADAPDMVSMMDREMYDYLCDNRPGVNPNQQELTAFLNGVTRVRAIASGMFRGKPMSDEVLLDTSDPTAIAEFRKLLSVVEDPGSFNHCGCLGGPTLELYSGSEVAGAFGLQHGHSFRWSRWRHDARLRDGELLRTWLLRHGIEGDFLDTLFNNQYDSGGMISVGYRRSGPKPLSRAEQQFRLAELLRSRGAQPAQARARCDQLLQQHPTVAYGYVVRALCNHQLRDPDATRRDCSRAIDLGWQDAEIYFTRAVANDQLGDHAAAIRDCDEAIRLDPDHFNAHNSRGIIRTTLKQYDDALQDFDEALRIEPFSHLPRLNRSRTHTQLKNFVDAIADCNFVIDALSDKDSPQERQLLAVILWNRGHCHRELGNEQQAARDQQRAKQIGLPGAGGN